MKWNCKEKEKKGASNWIFPIGILNGSPDAQWINRWIEMKTFFFISHDTSINSIDESVIEPNTVFMSESVTAFSVLFGIICTNFSVLFHAIHYIQFSQFRSHVPFIKISNPIFFSSVRVCAYVVQFTFIAPPKSAYSITWSVFLFIRFLLHFGVISWSKREKGEEKNKKPSIEIRIERVYKSHDLLLLFYSIGLAVAQTLTHSLFRSLNLSQRLALVFSLFGR